MRKDEFTPVDDCGCAPTAAEMQAFSRGRLLSRRGAIALGAFGVAAGGFLLAQPAWAALPGYPSWDDVQRAKNNESAKNGEISRIQGLIQQMQADVAQKQALAEQLAGEYAQAQLDFEAAADRANALQQQADAESAKADAASQKLGKLAAQQYRNGGGSDAALELFFSGSAASADDLLARLGTMDQLVVANRSVYTEAVAARDNAKNLSNQAQVARDERDRLQREAEAKMIKAQDAAVAAQAALDNQTANLATLQAQLAALQDTTAKTVAAYQAGVEEERRREEERKRREREEAARRAAEEERRRQEAAAAAGNGGGGGGGAGQVQPSGWVRPGYGGISSWFGNRGSICGNGYCSNNGHRGLDFAGSCGSPIFAAGSGRVIWAGRLDAWGNYIKVDHGGGIVTAYAHIRDGGYAVGYGANVGAGQTIAYVGSTGASTGCHLHFEVWSYGTRIDPAPFLRARGISV